VKKNILKIKNTIVAKSIMIWDKTKLVGKAFKREAHETEVASRILLKIVERKKVTSNEIKFLKAQSIDLGKALALIGLQAVPGSTIAIIAIEKFGQKHGFTLFPKAQVEPDQEKNDVSGKSS
jgi:hypothetical protein